jgi:expansin (peptidoglycan-binding protein)
LGDTSGFGDVTTYGGVTTAPSGGGACNYGPGGITHYAAIQVHRILGDNQGQWRGGRACGQCAEVRARTESGWKITVVRIVDKCPDGHCGIDLGGGPASELMGDKPGRYSGEWRFVPCEGHKGVSDGETALHVKEGSNPWWSLVQVRNASERILAMKVRVAGSGAAWTELAWATEAENFFKVPVAVLQSPDEYELRAELPHGRAYALRCKGSALAAAGASLPLPHAL